MKLPKVNESSTLWGHASKQVEAQKFDKARRDRWNADSIKWVGKNPYKETLTDKIKDFLSTH